MSRRNNRLLFAFLALVSAAGCDCGTRLVKLSPFIVVSPLRLDFGTVPTGTIVELPIDVTNEGRTGLIVSRAAPKSANDITVASVLKENCRAIRRTVSNPDELDSGQCARIIVRFAPTSVESITNVIEIASNDPKRPVVDVPVSAASSAAPEIQVCVLDTQGNVVPAECTQLYATPPFVPTIDFGTVPPGQTDSRKVRVTNTGDGPLSVTGLTIQSSSTSLSLPSLPALPAHLTPMQSVDLTVTFKSTTAGAVTGQLVVASDAPMHGQVEIPIRAAGQSACTPGIVNLTASVGSGAVPAGGVLQNTTVTVTAAAGGQPVSYAWSLVSAPAGSVSQIAGTGRAVSLDCTDPGTYVVAVTVTFEGGCTAQKTIDIPVMALPPACGPSTEFIYTMDEFGVLYKFVPSAVTMTALGNVNCPDGETVDTMAVDRNGVAWVEYHDEALFRVDTTTLQCFPTSFNRSSTADPNWGSCFAADAPGSTNETYFIAEAGTLASINTTSLAVTKIGTFGVLSANEPELTGTPSAELYGFFPGPPWTLAQINKSNATVSGSKTLNVISNNILSPGNWAFASWGSDFWFFVGDGLSTDIFHYAAATGNTTLAKRSSAIIVGAGVSPCVQAQ